MFDVPEKWVRVKKVFASTAIGLSRTRSIAFYIQGVYKILNSSHPHSSVSSFVFGLFLGILTKYIIIRYWGEVRARRASTESQYFRGHDRKLAALEGVIPLSL